MKWFRMYSDDLESEAVLALDDRTHRVWVGVLGLANRQTPRGTIPAAPAFIAHRLGIRRDAAERAIARLVGANLLTNGPLVGRYSVTNAALMYPQSDDSAPRVAQSRANSNLENRVNVTAKTTLQPAKRNGRVEKDQEGDGEQDHSPPESVAPAAPGASLVPVVDGVVVSKRPRARDLVFEAIQAVWPLGPLTDTERGRWNKAAKELRDGGVTPDEILAAARNWPNVMGTATMTPMALAGNLSLLLEGPQVNGRSNGTTTEHRQRVTQTAHAPVNSRAVIEAKRAQRAQQGGAA